MKKTLLISALLVTIISCSEPKQTISNLEKVLDTEIEESAECKTIAQLAKQDSLFNVEAFFLAASESKKITMGNCLEAIREFNKDYTPKIDNPDPEYPQENYTLNIQRNLNAKTNSYEDILKTADSESASNAMKFLTLAKAINGKLNNYMISAVTAVESKEDSMVGDQWLICPVCGDIYRMGDLFDKCDLCDTEADKFIQIEAGK